jgi:glycosyltransferase involved in cell wall biosynthesis
MLYHPFTLKNYRIAVLLPSYNEEVTIAQTINAFKQALPVASIYVYDNNSIDQTAQIACAQGAVVRHAAYQGKGHVVRRMFADIEADIYVLCDADATYDASAAPMLIEKLIDDNLDMVVAARKESHEKNGVVYRKGHRFGNRLLTGLVSKLFHNQFCDILSGYRIFSYRFVKTFPALSHGFDTETELTIHALELKLPVAEVPTVYYARPKNSHSKLKSYRDGWVILKRIVLMLKETKPLFFFGIIAFAFVLLSLVLTAPIIVTYFKTGLVPRIPTAVLAAGTMMIGFLMYTLGLVLQSVYHKHAEIKQLRYLMYRSVQSSKNKNKVFADSLFTEEV